MGSSVDSVLRKEYSKNGEVQDHLNLCSNSSQLFEIKPTLTFGPTKCDLFKQELDQLVQAFLHSFLPISNSSSVAATSKGGRDTTEGVRVLRKVGYFLVFILTQRTGRGAGVSKVLAFCTDTVLLLSMPSLGHHF